ncbi:MAG TPA: serine/threonine protein kinase [Planctomycetes bacterium]|nr:serine/threonine protein kinase [Planctomycetota bacterium]
MSQGLDDGANKDGGGMSDVTGASVDRFIGQTLKAESGRYRILEMIGSGGMGSVMKAETEGSGRLVAVKFLHSELAEDGSSSRQRFEREIKVLLDLKAFRGIVQIEDWGRTDDGILFLVMEYVKAPTLDKMIEDHPNGLGQIESIQIAVEILSVLEPIHHRGFVHRDLKPHNICVFEDPLAVRLLDFGLSKPFTEGHGYNKVTQMRQGKGSEIPGSPHYMAVEQFLRPKAVDARTDLYAVGIILYELLAGIPPFRGIYLQDILKQHKNEDPPPITQGADGGPISYRLQNVINKALQKAQEDRYQTAGEFKEDLFDVLNVLNKKRRPRKELDGRYRILRKIGQGGNSEVFESIQVETGDRFALKIAREGASDWDEETLVNEADRALGHDNIVKVFEFGTFEGRSTLVMEFLDGGSLEDLIQKYKGEGFPEGTFFKVVIDICRGLHHAHEHNIVHRDVKPGNVLFAGDGRGKICDFGIAKRFEQRGDGVQGAKNTTLAKGTAQYIPPEQCDMQRRVDRRADIYSLGVMMYEMLAGRLPFTDGILITQHLMSDPPPLEVKGDFRNPDALCKVVERCMQKKEEDRFQNMKELAKELVRISKMEPQKKAHKPVPLHTVPEEWKNDPSRGGIVGAEGGRPASQAPGLSVRKVFAIGIPLVVILAVVLAFVIRGDDPATDTSARTGGGGTTLDTAWLDEFNQLQDFCRKSDWKSVSTFRIRELGKHPEELKKLGGMVSAGLLSALGAPMATEDDLKTRIGEVTAVAGAMVTVGDEKNQVGVLRGFLNEARKLEGWAPTQSGFAPWRDEERESIKKAVARLEKSLGLAPGSAKTWLDYAESRQAAILDHNIAWAQSVFEQGLGDGTFDLPESFETRLDEILRRMAAERRSPSKLLQAFGSWALAGARSKIGDGPAAAESFLANEAAKVAGMDGASYFEELARVRRRVASDLDLEPRTLREALFQTAVRLERGKEFVAALTARFGDDPRDWESTLSSIEAEGLPMTAFRPVVTRVILDRLRDSALRSALESAYEASSDKAGFIGPLDDAFKSLVAKLDPGSRSDLDLRWGELTASFRKGGADLAWSALEGRRAAFKAEPAHDFKDVRSQLALYRTFCSNYPAHPGATALRDEASQLIAEFEKDSRWLKATVLARENASLLADPDGIQRRTWRQFAKDLGNSLQNGDWAEGLDESELERCSRVVNGVRVYNASWRELDKACLALEFAIPSSSRELFNKSTVDVSGADGLRASWNDEGYLEVEASPATSIGSPPDLIDGEALTLRIPLVLTSESLGLENEPLTLRVRGPAKEEFDFQPPAVSVKAGLAKANSVPLRVTLTDDRPIPPEASSARFVLFGREIKPVARPEATTIVYELRLLDFQDAKTEIRFELSAADAAGNPATVEIRRVRRELDDARDLLVRRRRRELEDESRRLFETIASQPFRSDLPKRAAQELLAFSGKLEAFQAYDSESVVGLAEDAVKRNVADLLLGWTRTLTAANVADMEKGIDSFLGDVARLERRFTGSDAATQGLKRDLAKRYEAARRSRRVEPTPAPIKPRPIGPVRPQYKKVARVNSGRFEFVRVDTSSGPAWIATREFSVGDAKAIDRAVLRKVQALAGNYETGGARWELVDAMPLVPCSPNLALDICARLDQDSGELRRLEEQLGGPVHFDLPSVKAWMAAGRMQTGGNGRFGWGSSQAIPRVYKVANPAGKREKWYPRLRSVEGDPNANPFHFLSGNAAEIARSGRTRFRLMGGSIRDATYNELKDLQVDRKGPTVSPRKHAMFSGFRLAIVPRR